MTSFSTGDEIKLFCHFPGDGLPSIASVDLEDGSESTDLQKARKLYAELTAKSMSIDSRESQVNNTIIFPLFRVIKR